MKHILFIVNSLSNKSGLERVACLMANIFSEKLNYSVCIINRDTKKEGSAYFLNDNVTGYLVENNNVQELAQVILNLMESSTLREQFSKRAKKHALVYSQRTVIKEWKKVVEN